MPRMLWRSMHIILIPTMCLREERSSLATPTFEYNYKLPINCEMDTQLTQGHSSNETSYVDANNLGVNITGSRREPEIRSQQEQLPAYPQGQIQSVGSQLNFISCKNITISNNQERRTRTSITLSKKQISNSIHVSQSMETGEISPAQTSSLEPLSKKRRKAANKRHYSLHELHLLDEKKDFTKTYITGEVFYLGDVYHYIKDMTDKLEFPVILIDHTHCFKLRVFCKEHHARFSSSKFVQIRNFRRDGDCIYVSGSAEVQTIDSVAVCPPEEVKLKAEKLVETYEPTGTETLASIEDHVNRRINIKGEIIQMSPTKKRQLGSGNIHVRDVRIADAVGSAKVTLWRDNAKLALKQGQTIEMKKVLVQEKDGDVVLSAQCYTNIQILRSNDDLPDIKDDETDLDVHLTGTIDALGEVFPYDSCWRCNYKRLDGNYVCKKCGRQYNKKTTSPAVWCHVSVIVRGGDKDLKLFTADVKKLLSSRYPNENVDDFFLSETVKTKLKDGLPFKVKFTENEDKVMTIVEVL